MELRQAHKSIFFEQAGFDLVVRILGQDDTLLIEDWFAQDYNNPESSPDGYIDGFYADGAFLQAEDVNDLVAAMAGLNIGDGISAYDINTLDEVPEHILTTIDDTWHMFGDDGDEQSAANGREQHDYIA